MSTITDYTQSRRRILNSYIFNFIPRRLRAVRPYITVIPLPRIPSSRFALRSILRVWHFVGSWQTSRAKILTRSNAISNYRLCVRADRIIHRCRGDVTHGNSRLRKLRGGRTRRRGIGRAIERRHEVHVQEGGQRGGSGGDDGGGSRAIGDRTAIEALWLCQRLDLLSINTRYTWKTSLRGFLLGLYFRSRTESKSERARRTRPVSEQAN